MLRSGRFLYILSYIVPFSNFLLRTVKFSRPDVIKNRRATSDKSGKSGVSGSIWPGTGAKPRAVKGAATLSPSFWAISMPASVPSRRRVTVAGIRIAPGCAQSQSSGGVWHAGTKRNGTARSLPRGAGGLSPGMSCLLTQIPLRKPNLLSQTRFPRLAAHGRSRFLVWKPFADTILWHTRPYAGHLAVFKPTPNLARNTLRPTGRPFLISRRRHRLSGCPLPVPSGRGVT